MCVCVCGGGGVKGSEGVGLGCLSKDFFCNFGQYCPNISDEINCGTYPEEVQGEGG